jgi:hypothetical protein
VARVLLLSCRRTFDTVDFRHLSDFIPQHKFNDLPFFGLALGVHGFEPWRKGVCRNTSALGLY